MSFLENLNMWEQMSEAQRLLYVCNAANSKSDRIDAQMVWLMEENMRQDARVRYTDLVSGEASLVTYRGLSEAQIQTQDTTQRYYFNLLHMPPEVKARCAWHAIEHVDS